MKDLTKKEVERILNKLESQLPASSTKKDVKDMLSFFGKSGFSMEDGEYKDVRQSFEGYASQRVAEPVKYAINLKVLKDHEGGDVKLVLCSKTKEPISSRRTTSVRIFGDRKTVEVSSNERTRFFSLGKNGNIEESDNSMNKNRNLVSRIFEGQGK